MIWPKTNHDIFPESNTLPFGLGLGGGGCCFGRIKLTMVKLTSTVLSLREVSYVMF